MKTMVKAISLSALFLVLIFSATPFCPGRELIEPTRTLQSTELSAGRISVFSETPGLDVFLDNAKVGQTPLLSMEVNAGTHKLRVEDSEAEILVEAGETLQLSLFKGFFIEIPKKEEKEGRHPTPDAEQLTKERKTVPQGQERKEYDPRYWPLNPRGPIR